MPSSSLASFLLYVKQTQKTTIMKEEDKKKIDEPQDEKPETPENEAASTDNEETASEAEASEETQEGTDKKAADAPEADPLDIALAKIDELNDKYLRKVAEFDNYRKRTMKEKTELILNGGEKVITKILPVIDDFERAIANGQTTDDAQVLREGLELIFKKFLKILEGEGVERIETENKDFDTDYHEAIAMVPGMGDDKKGKVIDCVQTGYTLNGKVIRFAKVAVGQ